jgi:phospholipid/cholesterol/gamma-HCH transport system permease protein
MIDTIMIHFLASLGQATLILFAFIGRFCRFALNALYASFKRPFYMKQFIIRLYKIGWLSLPVIGLTAFFTGAVLALQIYIGGSRFNAEQIVPSIVLISILRELGPVLGGLMLAGRVSASLAAEIGTMKVTEQIDALTTLSVNPIKYLVTPSILAGIVALPLLTLVGNALAVAGGWLVAVNRLGFNGDIYLQNTIKNFVMADLTSGLVKASVFGFLITLSGCYQGYYSKGGAQGVGKSVTSAVVMGSVLILAFNYILTEGFFSQ